MDFDLSVSMISDRHLTQVKRGQMKEEIEKTAKRFQREIQLRRPMDNETYDILGFPLTHGVPGLYQWEYEQMVWLENYWKRKDGSFWAQLFMS